MEIEGIYRIEMAGPYGWEPVATAYLEGGRYLAGGSDHHAVGRYELEAGRLVCEVTMFVQGQTRTLFGKAAARYALRFEGEVSEDRITGSATDGEGEFLVRYRATRLADLP